MRLANLLTYKPFSSGNLDNPLDVCYSKMLSAILLKDIKDIKIQAETVYINMVNGSS